MVATTAVNMLCDVFAQPFTMSLLGAALEHDFETHRHLQHVGALAARVAVTAGMSHDDAVEVGQAGLFHDIGKLQLRPTLLNAARPLEPREWHEMRMHPELGEQMLRMLGAPRAAQIVRSHHERLDGSGYPDGLRGAAIPWAVRLLAVVDAYDAMRTGRSYAPAVSHEVAIARLSDTRRLYDGEAVEALVATLSPREAPAPVS